MILWIIFALMTAAAILAVLGRLGLKPAAGRGGTDLAVYQDQLEEIGRDRSAGLIGQTEAEVARVEVSRRLLAAADAQAIVAQPTARAGQWLGRPRACALTATLRRVLSP